MAQSSPADWTVVVEWQSKQMFQTDAAVALADSDLAQAVDLELFELGWHRQVGGVTTILSPVKIDGGVQAIPVLRLDRTVTRVKKQVRVDLAECGRQILGRVATTYVDARDILVAVGVIDVDAHGDYWYRPPFPLPAEVLPLSPAARELEDRLRLWPLLQPAVVRLLALFRDCRSSYPARSHPRLQMLSGREATWEGTYDEFASDTGYDPLSVSLLLDHIATDVVDMTPSTNERGEIRITIDWKVHDRQRPPP